MLDIISTATDIKQLLHLINNGKKFFLLQLI